MTVEEKRNKIIESHKKKREMYSIEEIQKAIDNTSGALSSLKDSDLDKIRAEVLLCK